MRVRARARVRLRVRVRVHGWVRGLRVRGLRVRVLHASRIEYEIVGAIVII